MAPRANWKGFLRLSLVTCPVALFPATSDTEKVSFNQINRKTGHRIKYQRIDAETGEEVPKEEVGVLKEAGMVLGGDDGPSASGLFGRLLDAGHGAVGESSGLDGPPEKGDHRPDEASPVRRRPSRLT